MPDMAKENNFVLREAAKAACDGYYTHLEHGGKGDPAEERWIEALTAGADAITQVAVLKSRLAQVERERDAAVADIRKASSFLCRVCTKNDWPNCAAGRNNLYSDDVVECEDFEWCGVCAENSKEETE